jgi:hypothetical protein
VPAISSSRHTLRTVGLALVVVLGLTLSACGGDDSDDETSTGDQDQADDTTDTTATADDSGGDSPAAAGDATLAVDLERIEGIMIEGFDVTLKFYGPDDELISEREWSQVVPDGGGDPQAFYDYVLNEPVPAGQVKRVSYMRISPGGAIPPPQEPGCETTVDIADGDTARITLLFQGDPSAEGGCAAVSSATAEADEMLGMPRGLPAPGIVGLTTADAEAAAQEQGWTTRIVAEDGERFMVTEDYSEQRVNLVIEDGTVLAAARG